MAIDEGIDVGSSATMEWATVKGQTWSFPASPVITDVGEEIDERQKCSESSVVASVSSFVFGKNREKRPASSGDGVSQSKASTKNGCEIKLTKGMRRCARSRLVYGDQKVAAETFGGDEFILEQRRQ